MVMARCGLLQIVSYLTDALTSRSHDVTLFVSGDAHTRRAWSRVVRALRLADCADALALHLTMPDDDA